MHDITEGSEAVEGRKYWWVIIYFSLYTVDTREGEAQLYVSKPAETKLPGVKGVSVYVVL